MPITEPQTYCKHSSVEALRWDGTSESTHTILEWAGGKITGPFEDGKLTVHTLEGPLPMAIGDWALRGAQGEFWMNREDVFTEAYGECADV